jgi:hypothetical protein
MKINTKKMKEMLIYFGRKFDNEAVARPTIDGDKLRELRLLNYLVLFSVLTYSENIIFPTS